MCYMLILSTNVEIDLTLHNRKLINFSRELPGLPEERLLKYPYQWFVGSRNGCSCGFRQLCFNDLEELGFSEPQDWYPEENEDIEATLQFIKIIREMVKQGVNVDCLNVWDNQDLNRDIKIISIPLNSLQDKEFRFGENYHFIFRYK